MSQSQEQQKKFSQQPQTKGNLYPIYQKLKQIGNGSFGIVYLVKASHDQKTYIMKKIALKHQNAEQRQNIFRQVKIMQNINHVYIVKYLESFVKNKQVCIVMEHAQKGDLQKYLEKRKNQNKPLKQDQVIQWLIQLCLGLKYLHQKKILHRDLKADNIFITNDNELKIGDFGVSKVMRQTLDMGKTKIGTPNIMAPEMISNQKYNQKSDIWSLGCVIYKMMTFKYPYEADNFPALVAKLQKKKYPQIKGNYSQELKELVYEMLQFQPQNRPSVHKILQKPFVKKNISQILQNTINNHNNKDKFCKKEAFIQSNNMYNSSNSSLRRLSRQRRSLSSLSNSILTPVSTSKQNANISNNENLKNQSLKMVQFKQNYPLVVEENKRLRQQNEFFQQQKIKFEQNSQKLLQKLLNNDKISKQDALQDIKNHILNYVYP